MGLLPGMTLDAGRYRVARRLGEGGMGGVYLVEDARGGQRWALKEALNDATLPEEERAWAQSHFEAEVRIMRALRPVAAKARIPAYHDDFTENGRRYLVMEYIPGDTLEALIDGAHGPLPERDVLRWMTDVCRAMETLHGLRPPVILRDMKPGNIIVTPGGPARVIDFGIARTYKPGQMANTENLGTAAYASPEHHGQGQTDARSDVYSLGATMYHALTGREPQPLEEPTPGALIHWNPLLSPASEAIVARAMRLDPAQRFQSAREMRTALDAALASLPAAPRARQAPIARRQPVVTRPVPVASAPSPTGTQVPDDRVCPRCGFVNRAGARFCAHDGVPLAAGATPGRVVAPVLAGGPRRAGQGPSRNASPSAAARAGAPVPRPAMQAAPPTHVITTPGATHSLRAAEAFAQGRYQQAIRQGEAAVAQGHANADTLLTLARAYAQVGRHMEAAATFERAAQSRPEAPTLVAAGRAWLAAGKLSEAQVALTRAQSLAPQDAETCGLLGDVNLRLGRLAQAEGDFTDAQRLAPGATWPLVGLGRLATAKGSLAEAVRLLGQAAPTDPGIAEAYAQLGQAWLGQRRLAEAIRTLERARTLGAASASLAVALAMAYHATGRRQQAREALQEALRLEPNNVEARALLKSI